MNRQLELMLDGITGRLPEYGTFVKPDNAWLYPDSQVGYWEEVPYWFRGFYPLAVLTQDHRCLTITKQYIEAILASAQEDGFFGPRKLKTVKGKDGRVVCDLGPHFLIIPALIQHAEYTGDSRILPLLFNFFHFCQSVPEDAFIPSSKVLYRGWGGGDFGSIAPFFQQERGGDALPLIFWVYERKPESWLLDLAHRVYRHLRLPWDEWLNHHGVMFSQRFAAPGYYYPLSHDIGDLQSSEDWYTQTKATWGQMPRGAMAMDERLRPRCVDPRQAFEACAMVEFARSFQQLGRISGDTIWADRCEDVLFNHFTAALTQNMKAVAYLTAPNMAQRDGTAGHLFRNELIGNTSYIGYTPLNRCCGHNTGMGWPTFTESLWLASADDGLVAWCYSPNSVTAKVGPHTEMVSFRMKTDYPFSGEIILECIAGANSPFPLYLRVPRWASSATARLNSTEEIIEEAKGKYLCIKRAWTKGEVLTINFGMSIHLTRWPRNGSVTVDRGPLSYSLRIKENWRQHPDLGDPKHYKGTVEWPNWEVLPESPWNYALAISNDAIGSQFEIVMQDENLLEPWSPETAPLVIRCRAKRLHVWGQQNRTVTELQPSPVAVDAPVETIELIPLGCARLRISCFPVAGDGPGAWKWRSLPETVELSSQPTNVFDSGTALATFHDW
ncbi:beta-L-arabinofuranosidase domain-containing protein [Edaphobacter albus]|uniref:beta-L-arabinofuranosidase domain-containing protein n=1 Tax=Edaphobacter sp. 4G125 TaxID=2763071 RepID=UPI0016468DF4|nr:beta-L-arabinofuranosidase domain-containing protein [Edaphobacter sp. 4G125]QNI35753.1 glycoside hydrolase family 127 protein [Edaphobacter sp. 4G125]